MAHGQGYAALTRFWHAALAIVVIAGLLAVVGPQRAAASGIVGRGTPESCTEAALNAALIGGGYISFNCGSQATITVTGEKVITRNTRINGGSAVSISGGDTTRVFKVEAGVILELENIGVTHGKVTDVPGGAIFNAGTLKLTGVTIADSHIEGRSNGAGVYNSGTLDVLSSFFQNNSGVDSGGLGNDGTATIDGSIFTNNGGNWGGAIMTRGTLILSNSSLTNNSANQGYGAALYSQSGSTTVNDSNFSWNHAFAGGALFMNGGEVTFNGVTLNENTAGWGGGAYVGHGRLNVNRSTFLKNHADGPGGAITSGGGWAGSSDGVMTVVNSTFSENSAGYGGALATYSVNESSISYSTFVGNSASTAGGGFYQEFGTTRMTGVILTGSGGGNCTGIDPTSDGYNLSSDASCGLNQPTDRSSTDPGLGGLQNNGGGTLTYAPVPGSPVVEHGAPTCIDTDQRGNARPNGAACDIGSVEGTAPADTTAPVATAPADSFKAQKTASETTILATLTWSATDQGYGVERYEMERAIGGAAFSAVTLKDVHATSQDFTLTYGKTYRFRIRAIDRSGNVGDWAEAAPLYVGRYEETHAAVSYAGTWTPVSSSTTWGGATTYSKTAKDTATFTFEGSSIAFVSAVGTSRGKANVYIDDVLMGTIDLYSATTSSRAIVFKHDGLGDGQHTIRIRANGTKNGKSTGMRVDVTGFIVLD